MLVRRPPDLTQPGDQPRPSVKREAVRIVLVILLVAAAAELLIMVVFGPLMSGLSTWQAGFFDALLLSLIASPLIWFFIIYPYLKAEREMQEALNRARLRSEQADLAKTQFLASMSHEIRTPMTAVLGFADVLLETGLPPENAKYVEHIKSAGSSLLALINDILDVSKLDAAKLDIESIDLDLPSLIRDVMTLFRQNQSLDLIVNFADDFPEHIHSDPTRIRQILINLIGNAIKFTQEGSVTVTGARCLSKSGVDCFQISVTDTGIGMTEETVSIIFSEFTQADTSVTRKFAGTGLGLTICDRLVGLMNGELLVESVVGEGSTFTFRLPVHRAAEPGTDSKVIPAIPDEKPTRSLDILIVEDNPVLQQLVRLFVETFGHTATIKENGAEAVDAQKDGAFDLILMDIHMPQMSGLEATQIIRQLPDDRKAVPIIALTGNARAEEARDYFAAGMDACVTKPIDKNDLLLAINQAMGEEIHPLLEIPDVCDPEDGPGDSHRSARSSVQHH